MKVKRGTLTKMHGHFVMKCSKCEKVISQCRCMDGNKPVRYCVCQECIDREECK